VAPSGGACPDFENSKKGQYSVMLRMGPTLYMYGPHSLRACRYLLDELIRKRHIGCDCEAKGAQCPFPGFSEERDWDAEVVEIHTAWPEDIYPVPPENSITHQPQLPPKRMSKTVRLKQERIRATTTPIDNFAIFRPAFQEPLPELPPKKRKPKTIAELLRGQQ